MSKAAGNGVLRRSKCTFSYVIDPSQKVVTRQVTNRRGQAAFQGAFSAVGLHSQGSWFAMLQMQVVASRIATEPRRWQLQAVAVRSPFASAGAVRLGCAPPPLEKPRGLTGRSTGAPTAGHQARAGGTRYIFANPGLASFRRRPVNSTLGLTNPKSSGPITMYAETQASSDPPNEDFFRALEAERTRALVSRDVATIRRLHAPDYELISVPGRVMSLSRYLSLMEEDVIYANWEHGPMRVQIAQGMAAVRYQAKITFPSGNVVDCWHTDIYARRSGSWVAVWSQATRLPQDYSVTGGTP